MLMTSPSTPIKVRLKLMHRDSTRATTTTTTTPSAVHRDGDGEAPEAVVVRAHLHVVDAASNDRGGAWEAEKSRASARASDREGKEREVGGRG
jgi:hypothetical protein